MHATDTTSLTLRLPKQLRERLKKAAAADHRTISQFARLHLSAAVDAKTKKKSA